MPSNLLNKVLPKLAALHSHDVDHSASTEIHLENPPTVIDNKDINVNAQEAQDVEDVPDKMPTEDAQGGVKTAEAITLTWSRRSLIAAFINMWCLYCVNAFQANITANLTPFVISDFELHSMLPVIYMVSNIMSGAFYLPVAKTLDLWGRAEGFLIMVCVATLGLILMAVCKDIETFGAAQVFYSVGFSGMIYSIDVVTSDSSTLRSRGLAYAFTASPWIITAFAGPTAAESFYENISWRWGFGCFAIILPIVAAPLYLNLKINERKAVKSGILVKERSGRSIVESARFYVIEFDVLGVIVLAAGLILFLLPFSLADSAPNGWSSSYIIAMLVVGICLLFAFAFVERYMAPKPFIPWHLLVSRTLLGTCLLGATWQVAYYCWNSYFSSYLQVVYNLSLKNAGYISSTFDAVSGVWIFGVGFLIRHTGRFKWLFLCAVPLYTLAVALLIYFRQPHTHIGYVVMCQVFIAFAGGTLIICQQVAVLSVAAHGDVAAVLALLGLFGYMGGAVGNSVSGAIWTNTLPQALAKYLPESAQADLEEIYGDLSKQLSYDVGTPVRDAIIKAYAVAQTRMLIAGTAVMALAFVCVLMIKNINVSKIQQVKGMLF